MSNIGYDRQWHDAQASIKDILDVDLEQEKPEKDRLVAFQNLAVIYVKYITIFRKLEECYDQIVHPQKLLVIRKVLDGVMGRILELKNNMVSLELSEYHYFDDVISDLKITPKEIDIVIPKYFLEESKHPIKEKFGLQAKSKIDEENESNTEVKVEEVKLVQPPEQKAMEDVYEELVDDVLLLEDEDKLVPIRSPPNISPSNAAVKIQKTWKGFMARNIVKKLREEELVFIGMKPESEDKSENADRLIKLCEYRRSVKKENILEYEQALVETKEKIRDLEGVDIKERLQDQIRQWFIESRDATGKFPEYPSESEGGSNAIFQVKDLVDEVKPKEKDKKKEKKKKGEVKKEKKDKKEQPEEVLFEPSKFATILKAEEKEYKDMWEQRDETLNFQQKHDVEIIKEQKRVEVENEIRLQIDELMREELMNLKLVVDQQAKKGKKGKHEKKKKGAKKSKKKKGEKDLTPDRTLESLCEELVQAGILKSYPLTNLKDFIGDYSYLGTTFQQMNIENMPSLSDVRRVITEFCILPLGSQVVHENAPLIKSVLITGPRGCGKKMLLHAICTETGALFFDLTAANIYGKYPGKSGLKMMLHIIFKVACLLPPAVVYIGNCEKMFQKKIPKTDQTDPKRLKKLLPKFVKGLKSVNRVLLIGTTREPYNAEVKPLCSLYQKILFIPHPDYSSRFLLWPHLIIMYGGKVSDALDLSSLSKITDGYTPGDMTIVVKSVLTKKRIEQLNKNPLLASEFVPSLAKIVPVIKELETFKIWYAKTPLGKKRAKRGKENEDKKQAKGKIDKKKKKK
ncbi:dynein regulatory complex protein 11 isoform X2 [Hydra vulgaris]|uniref:dynein regulatory complex protein 11 isoform X2 n=1 Tax=Hydra vulgaris TaxID=6087 RepID=UPI0032EA6E19